MNLLMIISVLFNYVDGALKIWPMVCLSDLRGNAAAYIIFLEGTDEMCFDDCLASALVQGALAWGFSHLQVNSVLKALLITFNRIQNVLAELRRRYHMQLSKESKW